MAPQQPERGLAHEPEPAYEPGETRAAERSAERAAALAATEGFGPLRIRPYVAEPGGEADATAVRPPPASTDLGLFPGVPTPYAGLEYAQDEPVPVGAVALSGAEPGEYGEHGEYGAYAARLAAARGRHRRRRRGLVVVAAAVAASALAAGAVAVTGQVMGDEGRTDRAAPPDRSASMPDVELPTQAAGASGTATTGAPRQIASPSATASTLDADPSAPPASPQDPPAPTPTGSPAVLPADAPSTPDDPGTPTSGTTAPTDTPTTGSGAPPTLAPSVTAPPVTTAPAVTVLQEGDNGPAVADLQRRLTDVWIYHGTPDGHFDRGVARAVALFQIWYGVRGDTAGVYGPHTRTALEHQTS